jgi:hypothetical protein
VDSKGVGIDKALYYAMHPNGDATDMDKIEKVWKETISTKQASMVSERSSVVRSRNNLVTFVEALMELWRMQRRKNQK